MGPPGCIAKGEWLRGVTLRREPLSAAVRLALIVPPGGPKFRGCAGDGDGGHEVRAKPMGLLDTAAVGSDLDFEWPALAAGFLARRRLERRAEKATEADFIVRREETAAMRSQANTAKLMADNPTLMRLRELEILEKVAASADPKVVLGEKGLADRVMNVI